MSNLSVNYCKDKFDPTIKWHIMMIYGRFQISCFNLLLITQVSVPFHGKKALYMIYVHCITLVKHEKMNSAIYVMNASCVS
jgi:hypothetical protein